MATATCFAGPDEDTGWKPTLTIWNRMGELDRALESLHADLERLALQLSSVTRMGELDFEPDPADDNGFMLDQSLVSSALIERKRQVDALAVVVQDLTARIDL